MGWPKEFEGWQNCYASGDDFREKDGSAWLLIKFNGVDASGQASASYNLYTQETIDENPDKKYAKTNEIALRGVKSFLLACGLGEDDLPALGDGDGVSAAEARALHSAVRAYTGDATTPGTRLQAYIGKDSRGYNEATRFKKAQ